MPSTKASDERVIRWLSEIRVLDGGIGSECQRRSNLPIDGHKAWSCRLLKDDPNLVCDIHKSYIKAGADVISTNTYQAAPRTLSEAMGIGMKEAEELMRHAVRLARRAIASVMDEDCDPPNSHVAQRKLPILVAGSLGPYGACLADGSEYTGSYAESMSIDQLVDFHLERARILVNAGVDFIAWETIPVLAEVSAICEVMKRLPGVLAWLSVATQNGQTIVGGDPLHQVALEVDKCDQIFGIGVNCCIEHDHIGSALSNLTLARESCESGTEDGFHPPPCSVRRLPSTAAEQNHRKLLLVYANSGEHWLPPPGHSRKRKGHWIWPSNKGPSLWAREMAKWSLRRQVSEDDVDVKYETQPLAQWVGGCCRVTPEQIQQLAQLVKPDEFPHTPNESENTAQTLQAKQLSLSTNRRGLNAARVSQRKQPQRACKRFRSG